MACNQLLKWRVQTIQEKIKNHGEKDLTLFLVENYNNEQLVDYILYRHAKVSTNRINRGRELQKKKWLIKGIGMRYRPLYNSYDIVVRSPQTVENRYGVSELDKINRKPPERLAKYGMKEWGLEQTVDYLLLMLDSYPDPGLIDSCLNRKLGVFIKVLEFGDLSVASVSEDEVVSTGVPDMGDSGATRAEGSEV